MTQMLPPTESRQAGGTPEDNPAVARPSRLRLRRKLLLWSTPVLVLLLVLAVKVASVGILGNKLPRQFAARDDAAMQSTLEWIDVGNIGRGFREQFAQGNLLMLRGDVSGALEQFRAAHEKAPGACPPRGNYALVAETLSDHELKQGHFTKAREILTPAVHAANDDPACFTTFPSASADVRAFVGETPERLYNKLAALKAGALTKTPDGYDYKRAPGGGIDFTESKTGPCPYADDESRMKECITMRDREVAQKTEAAKQAKEQEDKANQQQQQSPADPNQPAPPPSPAPPAPGTTPGAEANKGPKYPDHVELRRADQPGYCEPDGTPLSQLTAGLCETMGPLP
ncbi:tetratricopeptide repeat protein [Mycolicibacterium fortuitum]|uniref:tetratricopeptide repeat protein n=1 Tax=Mycolicibacterium fortuitum TaxID=1766 RepID=UPI0007EC08C7|nr:tetratricopeptide repeat protein [Mycolicibacterium fortuitum]OBA95246.1 hypothetical protein A5668_08535 [Mycolicibacterium fortuitum]OBG47867.1 hypothetical protein A5670_03750 [Mycolicibacterium fortuitum]